MLSVIIPAYNEEAMIPITAKCVAGLLEKEKIVYELVFVNDGSRDATWEKIRKASDENPHVRGICFSRNFGKESAMMAGLAYAKGAACVIIDCDLQHPPEKIIEMYHLWENGYKVVEGVKLSRGRESFLHKWAAGMFYALISAATKIDMRNASDFKLMDREVVDAILKMPEKQFFFRAISSWVGFKSTSVEFEVQERQQGESKWSVKSLIRYAVTNITSFSSVPLQLVTWSGFLFFLFALVIGIQTLVRFIMHDSLEGFTTVIMLQLITSSILMIAVGIIGYYIAKIYDEVKDRPRYIVEEETGENKTDE